MLNYDKLLSTKVVLLSGGSQGIGKAIAHLFASQGAQVFLGDVLIDSAQRTAQEIGKLGGTCTSLSLDVTDKIQWQDVVDRISNQAGSIDVLVNNAGTNIRKPLLDMSLSEWNQVLDVNVKGVFLGTKSVLPLMVRANKGSIINMSSVAGQLGHLGAAAYSTSKGAVRSLTKTTAIQYGQQGVRANSLHPGMVYTPMTASTLADKAQLAQLEKTIPLGRVGLPEDVAQAALFLASDASSYMTGAEIVIDGGQTCYFSYNGRSP